MQEYSDRTRRAEAEENRRAEALKSWTESEWVLSCLRTLPASPLQVLSEAEIFAWYGKIKPERTQ